MRILAAENLKNLVLFKVVPAAAAHISMCWTLSIPDTNFQGKDIKIFHESVK